MKIGHQGTLDIYNGLDTAAARRTIPQNLHSRAAELMDRINAATQPSDLRTPPGNRLEKLQGKRREQWSIRINEQFRIAFSWVDGEATEVRIEDYH
jgi:proteic killer suppression protein